MNEPPKKVVQLETKMDKDGQRLTTEELARIDAYIDTAYELARRKAIKKWGSSRGQKELHFIHAEYHRLMDEYAKSIGLRSF